MATFEQRAQIEATNRYQSDQSAPYRVREAMLDSFAEGALWAIQLAGWCVAPDCYKDSHDHTLRDGYYSD